MKAIELKITGANAHVEQAPVITSGTVGVPVKFTFDESWDGFQKTVVFKAGGVSRDVAGVKDGCTVPYEVLAEPERTLRIGVFGVKGSMVLPTVWADGGQILPGTDPSGDASADPTLPVWQQIQQNMGTVKSINGIAPDENGNVEIKTDGGGGTPGESAYEIAVKNGFEGTEAEWLESLKGEDGKDGVTPDLSNYYTKEETDLFASGLESSFKGLLGDYYTAEQIDHMLGDISTALNELHAYAESLKGGEAV